MKNTTVIIGAGISGLLVARELASRDATMVVLEKSRGVGGRMSTKRVGSAVFDQGAQFFTVRDEYLEARVNCWARNGVVEAWPGTDEQRWVARPSMTGLAKTLAKGLPIKLSQQVQAVRWHESGCWEVDIAGGDLVRGERLVLSAPVPQSLALLNAGQVSLPPTLQRDLEAVDYHPCLALLVTLDGPSKVADSGEKVEHGPFRWVADNVRKGIAQNVPAAITFHVNREYSANNYSKSEEELFAELEPLMQPWLGEGKIVARKLHRWRYSEPRTAYPAHCVWLPDRRLGFCGDSFGGPRVEGAAVSGLALARKIVGDLETS